MFFDLNTKKLLGRIHKNSQVGLYTIPKVIQNCKSDELKSELTRQEREYKQIFDASLALSGYSRLNSMSRLAKARTGAMIKMGNMSADSDSKQAEMMIMGSTAGIVDMLKCIKNSRNASEEARQLAGDLIKTEEYNVTRLKRFL